MIREYCGKVKLASVLCSAALPSPINQLFALQESNPQPTNYKHGPQHYDRQAGGPAILSSRVDLAAWEIPTVKFFVAFSEWLLLCC